MFNDIAEREHRLLADAAEREHRLLSDAAERDRRTCELDAQREKFLLHDAKCARDALLADVQLQRDREAQREIDLRRDLYDLSRQRSHAAALGAELKCLKATAGPPTVAYEVAEVPVLDDISPPYASTVVQMPPSRPVTPVDNLVVQGLPANMTQRQPPVSTAIVHRPDAADALMRHSHAADTHTVYSCHGTSTSTLQQPFMPASVRAPTMYLPGLQHTQLQQFYAPPVVASDPVFTQYQSDTQPRLHTQLRMPVTCAVAPSEPAYTHTPLHTFSRPMTQPACTQSTVTSALPCQPTAPGDFAYIDDTMQRDLDRVDSSNVYTHSIEQLLADLPPPPHVCRQPIVSLSSVRTQTTASAYVNTDSTPSLSAHRYADTPLYVNTLPYSSLPLSRSIQLGQSNVTDASALYARSHTSDLTYASDLVALDPNITRSSYADNSQRLPIAVAQPGFSAFSRVEVPYSRPAVVDPTVQYAVCTSATADNVRPTVTAHTAPLQPPSIHWKKRFSYDYVQPDTWAGAPTHAAPATQSGYIRPQTSSVYLPDMSFGAGHSTMTSVGPPQPQPPPSSYLPHSHMMPLQVSTVPSALPPPSHLPFTVPISSSSQTNVTYLHVPQTHTVFEDVLSHMSHFMPPQVHPLCLCSHSPLLSLHTHSLPCIHNLYQIQQLILMLCQLD